MRLVVVGNGGFAVRCIKLMRDEFACDVALVVADPNAQVLHGVLERYCEGGGVPFMHAADVNQSAIIDAVRGVAPDMLFNVYSMQRLGRSLLSIPKAGAINFHNGPLPRYRGINVYSWAIVNGESNYGVTWHFMSADVDAGDMLAQERFEIKGDDTPTTLMRRGFDAGVVALRKLLSEANRGTLRGTKQDDSMATYYSRKDVPNGGLLDFSWTFERLERFVRGLDFRPLPNTFVRPIARYGGDVFHPQTVRRIRQARDYPLGQVVAIEDGAIHVQAADAIVGLADILGADIVPTTPPALAATIKLFVGSQLG